MFQLDVKNAFNYGDLDKKVYIEQLPDYIAQERNMICKLKKAIYGLKQSLQKFSTVIAGFGF